MKKLLYLFMFIAVNFAYGQDFSTIINSYLNNNQAQLDLQAEDINDLIVDRQSYSNSMELDNVYVLQRYQGNRAF